jgi:hypothetical protein
MKLVARCDLQLNGYPRGLIDLVLNSKGSNHPSKEVKSLGTAYIQYAKFNRTENIKTIFKTKHTLRSSLMKTRPERGNNRHSVSIAFSMNVAEATLMKHTDL